MIQSLSSAATLYLAPILSLASFLLALFAFLAPTIMLHSDVSLLTVSPSLALTSPGQGQQSIDGPTVRLGVLGSCSQPNNAAPNNCTIPSLTPIYDTSVLPGNTPDLLSSPTAATPSFILLALILSSLFFIVFTLTMLREHLGKLGDFFGKPTVSRISAWLGLLGFMIGLTAYLVLRMWFGKMVDDFNQSITQQGSSGPQLIASTSNAFTMIWVAYAFAGVPVVCALMKLHVTQAVAEVKA